MRFPSQGVYLLGFVVSLSQLGCSGNPPLVSATLNQNAALSGDLSANPLRWKVITSTIDRSNSTMATLFGNDLAVDYARAHSQQDYPAGSVLCLVTWTEREHPRWFGANIPDQVKSVEFVTVGAEPGEQPSYSYEKHEGVPLNKVAPQEPAAAKERTAYLLSLRAAVMP
jgi:hypothetical protein